jgi:hypothetical protein
MTPNEIEITKIQVGDDIVFSNEIYTVLEVDEKRQAVRINGEFEWISYVDFDIKHD